MDSPHPLVQPGAEDDRIFPSLQRGALMVHSALDARCASYVPSVFIGRNVDVYVGLELLCSNQASGGDRFTSVSTGRRLLNIYGGAGVGKVCVFSIKIQSVLCYLLKFEWFRSRGSLPTGGAGQRCVTKAISAQALPLPGHRVGGPAPARGRAGKGWRRGWRQC